MPLTLYYHPLASFCWKPLIALYENEIRFTPHLVDLADEDSRNDFFKIWPLGHFPVLHDEVRDQVIPQSSTIIEYLAIHYNGRMIPSDPLQALEARRWNDFCDSYLQIPMQKVVTDTFRPGGMNDSFGVEEAYDNIRTAYDILETQLQGHTWCAGDTFSIADCAAAPALFYADKVEPLGKSQTNLSAYLSRLRDRPSFARVLNEAAPFLHQFPIKPKIL